METLQSPPPPINASTTSSTTTTSNTSSQTATTSTDGGQGLGLQLGLAGTNDGPRATGMTNQDVSAPSLTSLASPGIKVELHHGASDPALSSQHQHQHQHQQPATAGAAHDTTGAHDAQPPLAPHPRYVYHLQDTTRWAAITHTSPILLPDLPLPSNSSRAQCDSTRGRPANTARSKCACPNQSPPICIATNQNLAHLPGNPQCPLRIHQRRRRRPIPPCHQPVHHHGGDRPRLLRRRPPCCRSVRQ